MKILFEIHTYSLNSPHLPSALDHLLIVYNMLFSNSTLERGRVVLSNDTVNCMVSLLVMEQQQEISVCLCQKSRFSLDGAYICIYDQVQPRIAYKQSHWANSGFGYVLSGATHTYNNIWIIDGCKKIPGGSYPPPPYPTVLHFYLIPPSVNVQYTMSLIVYICFRYYDLGVI